MTQTVQRETNQMPAWLMSSGAVVGALGAIVKKHAETIGELIGRLRSERPSRTVPALSIRETSHASLAPPVEATPASTLPRSLRGER